MLEYIGNMTEITVCVVLFSDVYTINYNYH